MPIRSNRTEEQLHQASLPEGNYLFFTWMMRLVVILMITMLTQLVTAQDKQTIQVKTFDQKLQVLRNIEVSINDREYVSVGSKGVVIIELNASELPIKSIKIKDDKLEAASWNFSKGIVEIIVRPKSYTLVHLYLRFPDANPVPQTSVSFKGAKTITVTTNQAGEFDLPLSLNDKITSPDQFQVEGLKVSKLNFTDKENIVVVERPKVVVQEKKEEVPSIKEQLKDFDITRLDSIRSLTVFYAVFKNISIGNLSDEAKQKIDAKFNELVAQMKDSVSRNQPSFIGSISDSSFVTEDIRNLLNYATVEQGALEMNRLEFENKIKVIGKKLEKGISNLSEEERKLLLTDLDNLEQLLIQNESKFYQNQNDYREIINTLKEKYFDIQNLETRLSNAEKQREEEQRKFRNQLFMFLGILFVFGVLILMLVTFSGRMRKQAKELKAANEEVKTINENLEAIVVKRTSLLEESNKELDTFLYRASHDLRSPIRSIIGLVNLSDHIPQSELVGHLKVTSLDMDRMLQKLIDVSEISQESLRQDSINVGRTINDVKSKHNQLIKELGVQFHVDCPDDILMLTSPTLIENILTNLIENAVFYSSLRSPDHARVEVKAEVIRKNLELSVYDNGVGIDESMRPQLFNMFFTGHELSKGSGLGLYTVRKCVNALNGKITVDSELGRFTKFSIVLPYTEG